MAAPVSAQPATPDATPQPTAAAPRSGTGRIVWHGDDVYVLIAVVIAAVLFLVVRQRKDKTQPR